MSVLKRRLATAVLFVATCTTTVLACTSGGYPAPTCQVDSGFWTIHDGCSIPEPGCPANYYACCDPGSCHCIAYGD